ncbi:DUF2919 family protein [Alteromonas sp. KUL49]|uniref:DUF2919 family protein n=1 Tax=Alteromonas sp. KUL49 TaxID=2480798 RepID=UPI00102F2262|nr:DUF2919 family protein [Alteromonas sp. KUL49]TAP35889.1 DUF2919 domain-containing protein [Alteromonas sp. KUL49]
MLKLPLNCYDESGRILPPKWFYWLCGFLCIDWLVFVFSLASREHTTELLSFFYPNRSGLIVSLLTSMPILMSLLLVSQRERLWKKSWLKWSSAVIPFVVLGAAGLMTAQLYHLSMAHWDFEWVSAIRIVGAALCIYVVLKSRHIRYMKSDWLTL